MSAEEWNGRLLEKIDNDNDPDVVNLLGNCYREGLNGFSIDTTKAVELYCSASEPVCANAHHNLGQSYVNRSGVEDDLKKAIHHWQKFAMLRHENSRYNLGIAEENDGNMKRAMKHNIIAEKNVVTKIL